MKGIISIQSHVVYGHAGNSSAVFPMQRMGFEVWPIHTVQFSNHTQYAEGWTGRAFTAADISDLIQGLDHIHQLENCMAVITGYQGSPEQCAAVVETVQRVKKAQPEALYFCDPVMSAPGKGCIVAPGIAEELVNRVMPVADVLVPNQYELERFTGMEIQDVPSAVLACRHAMSRGPRMVLVKHLQCVSSENFSMMLATEDGCFLAQRPHLSFEREPVGVGDLISGIFTVNVLRGMSPREAFEHCHNAVYGVLRTTLELGEWELQTIAAQAELAAPSSSFGSKKID